VIAANGPGNAAETIVREALVLVTQALRNAGVACNDYADHAHRLLREALGIDAAGLLLQLDRPLSPAERQRVDAWVRRRCAGEPLQYIAGKAAFWDFELEVGPGCLIPRPETEHVVRELLHLEPRRQVTVAELGAGTGCIGLACLRERPEWRWNAFERSLAAAAFADRNAARVGVPPEQYRLERGDFFVTAGALAPFDWIVSNPPYVPRRSMATLSVEVRHEPREALDGGDDGLAVIRPLVEAATRWLRPGGGLVVEIDESERRSVPELFEAKGFETVTTVADYAGLPRVVYGRWRQGLAVGDARSERTEERGAR
jgi:release factor glutamine methyltransferase